LAHGAILAREGGIPAVVGLEGATEAISDGGRVRIDGDAGTVTLLS
jgi:pyruvate,water dikinase